jgi:hypothetical protein
MELLFVEGIDSVQSLGRFVIQLTTPEYFDVMGTRIVRGRPFTADDRAGTPRVTVVSESMAQTLWPGQDALGKCIRIRSDTMPCTTVIGIAEDAAYNNLTDAKRLTHYLPLEQTNPGAGSNVLIRLASGDARRSVEAVRHELQKAMPGQSYVTVHPLAEFVDTEQRSWMLGASMFVAFGVLALVVAAVGLYGVISYNVAQRMQELGVRIALGAQWSHVVRLVVGQGVSFAAYGIVVGLAVAMFAARWIQPLLFKQDAIDFAVYGAISALVVCVAVLASVVPAVRASRADPSIALRGD